MRWPRGFSPPAAIAQAVRHDAARPRPRHRVFAASGLHATHGRPSGILPRIDAPGDIDDGYLSLRVADNRLLSETLMDVPPPVSSLERQLILSAEIMKLPGMASSPQKAIQLGGELGRFIDILQSNNIELGDVDRLVPEAFKAQWARTAEFLKIITETWPQKLREMGKSDPEAHRNAMIQIQAAHWRDNPPENR